MRMPQTRKSLVKLCLVALLCALTVALLPPGTVTPPAHATFCEWAYYDTIYTDSTKTEECGSYDSCTNTRDGCQTPYRTTEIYYCCR
jgi:hypothetical protein